ncbi:hypothetical protein LPJ57_001921 [Coemansia sp. RSA 486]|nr:hypothetical protein LPJ57_001921 [Coemansia sp. RSA 486]KAJ2232726.1 hypothetical protein IWW45_004745 [Coemansia sp. RSA 485]KAJ2638743.1 hypothetical protein GGF40_001402 [Coemansia sp. RSA 1286]
MHSPLEPSAAEKDKETRIATATEPETRQQQNPNQSQSHRPASSSNGSSTAKERAIPLLRSCERCRRRKQRCDGEQPVCGRCKSHRADCSYRQSGRFRKRFPRTGDSDGGGSSGSGPRKQAKQHASTEDALSAATTLSALSSIQLAQSSGASASAPALARSSSHHTQPATLKSSPWSPAVPELSPCTASEPSPNDPLVNTPMSDSSMAGLLGAAKSMDPVAILKAYSLPDLSQGLPEHIVRHMWALISEGPVVAPRELSPNMDLLDPRNTAANSRNRYGVSDLPWLQGDALANLDAASSAAPSASASPNPQPRLHAHPHPHTHTPLPPSNEAAWLAALLSVVRRHDLGAAPASVLALLQAEHDDTGLQVGARQFWATLEAGTASDFEVLAHIAVAAASATGSASSGVAAGVEIASYEAARREWERGLVRPGTGAVCALLQLSEYGYRTGRSAVQWEFAQIAEAAARRIDFRGHAYPWRGARIQLLSGKCDSEYEHVLAVFWTAWAHALAAAQVLARRVVPLPDPLDSAAVPELPQHDMCRHAARFPPAPCRHTPGMAYGAAVWRCHVIAAHTHAALMDVREGRAAPSHYFAAVNRWNTRMRTWFAAWPSQWDEQMAHIVDRGGASGVEDAWLLRLHLVYQSARLRVHATALALLHGPPAAPGAPGGAPLSRNILVAQRVHPDSRRRLWGFSGGAFDPLGDALLVHRGRYESLEAVQAIETLLGLVDGSVRLRALGCWVVSVLDLAIALHCGRMAKEDADTQVDAVRRLGVLVALLLQLRRWTAALYVFTSIVKAYVEPTHLIDVHSTHPGVLRPGPERASPWPATHVLTLLMRELDMQAPEFCGLTLPVVYASVLATPAMPHKMRMRIESLLS